MLWIRPSVAKITPQTKKKRKSRCWYSIENLFLKTEFHIVSNMLDCSLNGPPLSFYVLTDIFGQRWKNASYSFYLWGGCGKTSWLTAATALFGNWKEGFSPVITEILNKYSFSWIRCFVGYDDAWNGSSHLLTTRARVTMSCHPEYHRNGK